MIEDLISCGFNVSTYEANLLQCDQPGIEVLWVGIMTAQWIKIDVNGNALAAE